MLKKKLIRTRVREKPREVKKGQSFYEELYKPQQSTELYSLGSGQPRKSFMPETRFVSEKVPLTIM